METEKINLNINPGKCSVIHFSNSKSISDPSFKIAGKSLEIVESVKYLGIIINNKLDEREDIYRVRNKFFNKFNMLLRKYNTLNEDIFLYLFKSLCMQFYGAELWLNFSNCSQILKQFRIGYHKAIKKIFNVSYRESNHYICNTTGLYMFDNYIDYLRICKIYRLLRCPCIFVLKNKNVFLRGFFAKKLNSIFKDKYNILNVFCNDLDAVKSRIFYVQNLEDGLR